MKLSSVSPERCDTICGVAGLAADRHRLEGLGDGADLVDLDQRGVRERRPMASAMMAGLVHEDVVADELDAVAEPLR